MNEVNTHYRADGTGRTCRACALIRTKRQQAADRDRHIEQRKTWRANTAAAAKSAMLAAVKEIRDKNLPEDVIFSELRKVLS